MDKNTVYNLFQEHKDLTLNGYFYVEPGRKPYEDTEEELRSAHNLKSYQYIHEFLDILQDHGLFLKNPNRKGGTSYGWKHRVEDYTCKDSDKNTWHHIPNGLFIAVLRERGLPERQIDGGPNAFVPLGHKAYDLVEKLCREWKRKSS